MPVYARSKDIVSKRHNRQPTWKGDEAAVRLLNDPRRQRLLDKISEVDGLGIVTHPTSFQVQSRRSEEGGQFLKTIELRIGEKTMVGHREAHEGRGGFSREREDGISTKVFDDESEEGGIAVESQGALGGLGEARGEAGGEKVRRVEVDLVAAELEVLPTDKNSVCII